MKPEDVFWEVTGEPPSPNMLFWCPGCGGAHGVNTRPGGWRFNGDMAKPTLSPSVLVKSSEFTKEGWKIYDAWVEAGCPKPAPAKFESKSTVCHSFVRNGCIEFLSDCTHALAGKTVPLAPPP